MEANPRVVFVRELFKFLDRTSFAKYTVFLLFVLVMFGLCIRELAQLWGKF